MKPITCHRCGEHLTAPYFHEGHAYGYSCIKIVNPTVKGKKIKEHWVIADNHNLDQTIGKQLITAYYANKRYKFYAFSDYDNDGHTALQDNYYRIIGAIIYINIAAFNK